MSYLVVSHYFEQLNSLFVENHYPADAIYNMDESGFSLGSTGNNKVIVSQVTRQELRKFKKIPGRQEWITSIECIGASGVTLPPLVIFKAKNTNSSWLPTETPSNWLHATSNSGWTSDFLTLEWLDHCFIPNTRRNDGKRILLLIDRHSSHLTSKFIAKCMNASIDLTNMPPHTSHRLQPLDIGIFGPLKRNLIKHLEYRLRYDSRRLQRVEWIEAFIKARRDSFRLSSIESSFQSAGIYPFDPLVVLSKLDPPLPPSPLSTPPPPDDPIDLDDSLLRSSPPEGVSLRQLKNQVESVVSRSNLESPAKRYLKRSQTVLEKVVAENAL